MNVRSRLIYRRAFRFLVDAKQWTQDGHGKPLEDVLAPHYGHLMESTEHVVEPSGNLIPAMPQWGVALMALLALIAGTVTFWRSAMLRQ